MVPYSVRSAMMAAAFLSLCCLPLSAQSSYGSIVGTVTDATGAIVPGAAVTLTNAGTSERRVADSDSSGNYTFVNLNPGDYRLDIEKSGFKHMTREFQVTVSTTSRIDASMQVGEIGQTIEVTGQAALLQTENASLGQVVAGRAVLEMPLNGRNVMNLIEMAPGVVAHGGAQGQTSRSGYTNFQISGGLVAQGRTLIDGVSINTALNNSASYVPIQDSIQEFQVMSNNLPPEFGHTANGIINLVTKSGSNELHGTLYEFLRNKVLNASPFFSNAAGLEKPSFTQNQWGGSAGGAIIKNKTFFFGAFEVFDQRLGVNETYTVPSAALKLGDFSNLRTAAGSLITVYDPATTCGQLGNAACAAGQTVLRTPFPGNKIPATRFDKSAVIFQKWWPKANSPGLPFTEANNFIVNYSLGLDRYWENVRFDQYLGTKHRMFGRATRYDAPEVPYDTYYLGHENKKTQYAWQAMLAETYTISPTTVLDMRVGWLRTVYERRPASYGVDLTTFGWPSFLNQQLPYHALPYMTVTGFSTSDGNQNVGAASAADNQHSNVGSLAGNVTKIVGRHTIKFGGEYSILPTEFGAAQAANFRFTQNFTARDPNSLGGTGSAYASYLLGLGSQGTVRNDTRPYGNLHMGGLFIGDTFQASKRLTLNFGVRWDYPGYYSERYDAAVTFMPQAVNPVLSAAGLKYLGDVVLVNSDRFPYGINTTPNKKLFGPRFGAAYRVSDNTVVRLGFGISFPAGATIGNAKPGSAPINAASTAWVPTSNGGLTPVATLSNPFPDGVNPAPGRDPSYERILLGSALSLPIYKDVFPYIMNWNAGFERQFGSTDMVGLAYVATRGVHLRAGTAGGPNLNQLSDENLSLGSQLLTQVPNPFYGVVKTGLLAQPTVPRGQLLLPFPQYTRVDSPTTAAFDAFYHSLEAKYQKRLQAGGTILFSYQWSKNTGNAEPVQTNSRENSPGTIQNYNNLRKERSLISYDVPQRLVVSYVLDLPFGKGKHFMSGVSGITDKLVSGWGLNGKTTLQKGFPLALIAAPTQLSTNFGSGTPRPNVVAGCAKVPDASSQQRISQWFNTSCFSQPAAFGYGSESRVDSTIRTAGIANYDFALFKNTSITERIKLQFRVESFNLFNRVQFNAPGNQVGTAQFGVVSDVATQTDPRVLQLGLRLSF